MREDPDPGGSWGFAAVWLVLLVVPFWFVLSGDLTPLARGSGLLGLAAFLPAYVLAYRSPGLIRVSSTLLRTYLWLALLLGLLLLTVPALGGFAVYCATYPIAVALFCLPPRHAAVVVSLLLCVAVLTVWFTIPADAGGAAVLLGVGSATTVMVGVRWFSSRDARLGQVREELRLLTEREQLARDVHDVLGHSLTVVSVKAQLAERLLERDPARAHRELQDIQRLSRRALHEIRSTVSRLRTADLDDELVSARTALDAAGIELHLPGGGDAVLVGCRPLFAWVLREAVTNVVRHSGARRCWVVLEPRAIRVSDDGAGGAVEGHGLRGVRQRSEETGGVLRLDDRPGGGTVLQVEVRQVEAL